MLEKQLWMRPYQDLTVELSQSADEGKDVKPFEAEVAAIETLPEDEKTSRALALYEQLRDAPVRADFPYVEPSDLESIRAARPTTAVAQKDAPFDTYDKIYGGLLGRCAGCLLGQPVEGWKRAAIVSLLKDTGNYPSTFYISSDIGETLREKHKIDDKRNWINNVAFMPEDDDTNYTIIGLKVLERHGKTFTADDVGEIWLSNLPLLHTCTAERAAYRNLAASIAPPDSAVHANPYREWIGAQIRADAFGYVFPNDPESAATAAFRDASVSHVKNGIYGEMFVAAAIAAAFADGDITRIITAGLSQIPEQSRFFERITDVLTWRDKGLSSDDALDRIHVDFDEYDPHHWCHAVSNAVIVCAALLYGESDLERTIGFALEAGFDTDCNCATAGSILGVALGANKLPRKWIDPLNDTVKSGVDGFGVVQISDIARRLTNLALT